MSTNVLGATPNTDWEESWVAGTTRSGQTRGFRARRAEFSEVLFEGRYTFEFSPTACSYSGFKDFFVARDGAYDSFLWKARVYDNYKIDTEAVGTGDGGTTSFTLDMKHIDGTTLTVYIDAATVTAYTLSANNTTPAIVFDSAVTNTSAVTADYEFYYPVTFTADAFAVRARTGSDLSANQITRSPMMVFRQDSPGSHKP